MAMRIAFNQLRAARHVHLGDFLPKLVSQMRLCATTVNQARAHLVHKDNIRKEMMFTMLLHAKSVLRADLEIEMTGLYFQTALFVPQAGNKVCLHNHLA